MLIINRVFKIIKIAYRRPGDITACFALSEKAKKLLGWKALRTIDDMCLSGWVWKKNKEEQP